MKTNKPSLIIVSLFLSVSFLFGQSNIIWQRHHGQGEGIFIPGPNDPPITEILNELTGGRQPVHGDPGGFQYAEIPPVDDADWETAPIDEDGDLCWRLNISALNNSFTALDFTYFQTVINVLNPNLSFIIRYFQVDDGVRAYVFNSAHPEGAYIEGGDARLFTTPKDVDLSSLFVVGVNRIVLVQFDDSQTRNFLKAAVITDEEVNECANDTEPPRMYGILEDGSEVLLSELLKERYDCGEQPFVDVRAIDNCDPKPSFNRRIETSENGDGTSTVAIQFGVRDKSGNVSRENYSYIDGGEDREPPRMFGILPDGTEAPLSELIQERFDCNEQPFDSVRVVDNCDPEPSINTVTTLTLNPDGSQNIIIDYTVRDASGNENQEVYSYVDGGEDRQLPVISRVVARSVQGSTIRDTIPINSDFRTDVFPCTTTAVPLPYEELLVEDNCDPDPDLTITIDTTFDTNGSLVSRLLITAEDINGNINQKSYTYIIEADTEAPQLNCSLNSVRFALDDTRTFIPNKDNLNIFAFDDCSSEINYEFEPAIITRTGSNIVNVMVSDAAGNSSVCAVEVFIEGLPCDLAIDNVGGQAASCLGDASGSLIILTSGANGVLEYSIDGTNFQSSNVFNNLLPKTYEILAREAENPNCVATASFTIITDADDEAPVILAALEDESEVLLSEFLQETYSCGERPFLDIKVADNCDLDPSLEITIDSTLLEDGSLRFNLIINSLDTNNNQTEESYEYIILADEAPQIFAVLTDGSRVLLSEALQATYDCAAVPFTDLVLIDDCDPNPNLEVTIDSTLRVGALDIDLRVKATDSKSNVTEATYNYSILDAEAPKIFAISSTAIEENGEEITIRDTIPFSEIMVDTSVINSCGVSPLDSYIRFIAMDNCDEDVVPLRTSNIRTLLQDSDGNDISEITVKYTATDRFGNTSADSVRYLSVTNDDAPVFTECPRAPIIVNLNDLDEPVFVPEVGENIPAIAEDACDGEELTFIYEPTEITTPGVFQISITAVDSDGNESATCTVIVNAIANINDSPNDNISFSNEPDHLDVQLYPNPFYGQTSLQLNLLTSSNLIIEICDINSRVVHTKHHRQIEAGTHKFDLNLNHLDKGVYFLSVKTETGQQNLRFVVL
ncbi:MAG: T9SS type A sorting domain-containing protein [Bacteroidota bacterium]